VWPTNPFDDWQGFAHAAKDQTPDRTQMPDE
jgi:hypothetical protein